MKLPEIFGGWPQLFDSLYFGNLAVKLFACIGIIRLLSDMSVLASEPDMFLRPVHSTDPPFGQFQ
jgi:hypothetical protein